MLKLRRRKNCLGSPSLLGLWVIFLLTSVWTQARITECLHSLTRLSNNRPSNLQMSAICGILVEHGLFPSAPASPMVATMTASLSFIVPCSSARVTWFHDNFLQHQRFSSPIPSYVVSRSNKNYLLGDSMIRVNPQATLQAATFEDYAVHGQVKGE